MDSVSICNMALSTAGTRSTISSLTEKSPQALQCALWYDITWKTALAAAWWNFAQANVALALLKQSTDADAVIEYPWPYEFAYPTDCVSARFINTLPASPPPFKVAADKDADGNDITVILTLIPTPYLSYTRSISNPNNWPTQFVDTVVYALASRLTIGVSGDLNRAKVLIQLANGKVLDARVSDGNEGTLIQDRDPDWITARYSDTPRITGFPGYRFAPFGNLFTI